MVEFTEREIRETKMSLMRIERKLNIMLEAQAVILNTLCEFRVDKTAETSEEKDISLKACAVLLSYREKCKEISRLEWWHELSRNICV